MFLGIGKSLAVVSPSSAAAIRPAIASEAHRRGSLSKCEWPSDRPLIGRPNLLECAADRAGGGRSNGTLADISAGFRYQRYEPTDELETPWPGPVISDVCTCEVQE